MATAIILKRPAHDDSLVGGLGPAEFTFLHPWEIGANLLAELLDGMVRAAFHYALYTGASRLVFRDPFLRELALWISPKIFSSRCGSDR